MANQIDRPLETTRASGAKWNSGMSRYAKDCHRLRAGAGVYFRITKRTVAWSSVRSVRRSIRSGLRSLSRLDQRLAASVKDDTRLKFPSLMFSRHQIEPSPCEQRSEERR